MNRKSSFPVLLLAATLFCCSAFFGAPAVSADDSPKADMDGFLKAYETIRLDLLQDRWESGDAAATVKSSLQSLSSEPFNPATAGVAAKDEAKATELLGQMAVAGQALAAAADLETARNAFYDLTKPLVHYRELMTGDKPAVAYCPMAKKSWLQPKGEIGNPYHGQSMPRCGQIVSE